MSDSVIYAYGVVRADFPAVKLPKGLDDAPVTLVREGKVAALATLLPARAYAPSVIEQNSGEVAWLSPRAMAHDRVLTWAQEHGGVIPLPMFSMWGSPEALSATLRERSGALADIFSKVGGADEFGLRVYRRDAAMLDAIDSLDTDIASVRAEAAAASPGQRYLLERKINERAKAAIRSASQRIAREIFDGLRPLARDSASLPLTPDTSGSPPDSTMVLNGAFLVGRDRLDAFRAAVGEHMRRNEPKGLAFDFTGPWPPYNFVAAAGGAAIANSPSRAHD